MKNNRISILLAVTIALGILVNSCGPIGADDGVVATTQEHDTISASTALADNVTPEIIENLGIKSYEFNVFLHKEGWV